MFTGLDYFTGTVTLVAATACATKHPNTLPKYDTISRSESGITMHVDRNIKMFLIGYGATSTALTQTQN